MRIAHVIETLGRGGAEQALVNLLSELVRRGHTCDVVALCAPYDLASSLEAEGIRVHSLGVPHRWDLARTRSRLGEVLQTGRYDVIHAHLFFAELAVGFWARGVRARVVTFHNLAYDRGRHDAAWKRVRKMLHGYVLRNLFDGRVAVSRAVGEHYSAHLAVPPAPVIPNGLPTSSIRELARSAVGVVRAKYAIELGARVLVVPARLVPEKGHTYLLQALELVGARDDLVVLLVGDGPLREDVSEEIVARGLSGVVRLLPSLSHGDLFPLISASDVFISSSVSEGLPVALIEAAAVGIPILATAVGGVPDIVENEVTGLLVPAKDPAALARGIDRLLSEPALCQRMVTAAGSHVEEHFDISVVAQTMEALYRSLLPAECS